MPKKSYVDGLREQAVKFLEERTNPHLMRARTAMIDKAIRAAHLECKYGDKDKVLGEK